jgi:S-(hydroxymethyl)glutathione dehydrogenase / alcohol dehydrogenase
MGTTVRAAVVTSAGSGPELGDVVLAPLADDEVLIRIAATGLCHTDVAWAAGDFGGGDEQFPIVLGHESSGVVEAVGRPGGSVAVGDRVVVALTHHCGVCRYCERGEPVLCVHRDDNVRRITGLGGQIVWQSYGVGGFAEMAVVRASSLVQVPPDVPLATAAIVGCAVACGIGAVWNVAQVRPGSTVVVFGAGPVGMSVLMGAALAGAERVVAVEPNEARRALAMRFGATETRDFTPDALSDLRDAGDVDYTFESAGKTVAMQAAVETTRRGGTITLIGAAPRGASLGIDALAFVERHLRLLGCLGGAVRPHEDIGRYFALYRRGVLPLDELVTGVVPLAEIGEAFAASHGGTGLRTVVTP